MKIKIKDTAGIILKTKNTLIEQDIKVNPDTTNLTPDNILTGVTVLGVVGTYTDDATATSEDLVTNTRGYSKGTLVNGSIPTYDFSFEGAGTLLSKGDSTAWDSAAGLVVSQVFNINKNSNILEVE